MSPTPLPALIDDSDACITSQFLAADRTAVDLEPLGADATGEIDALDILEIRTPAPGSAARTSRLPIVVLTPRLPLRPPSMARRPAHPSSIAPLSLDVMAPRTPSASSHVPGLTGSTMLDLLGAAGAQRSSRLFALGSSLAALCLVAATVGAVLGYDRSSHASTSASSTSTAPGFHAPRTPDVLEAREEITILPADASGKARGTTTEAPPVVAPSVVPSLAPTGPTAAPHHPAAATGVLHVPGAMSGALVDGVPHRVSGNELTVTCGRHRVKLPDRAVRNVDVPCGGTATF